MCHFCAYLGDLLWLSMSQLLPSLPARLCWHGQPRSFHYYNMTLSVKPMSRLRSAPYRQAASRTPAARTGSARPAVVPRHQGQAQACPWYILCTHPRTASQATVPAPTSAPLPSISIGFKCVMSSRLDGSATGNLGLSGAPPPATGGKIRFLPATRRASSARERGSSGTIGMTSDGDDT